MADNYDDYSREELIRELRLRGLKGCRDSFAGISWVENLWREQKLFKSFAYAFVFFKLAFPHDKNIPSHRMQSCLRFYVAFFVAADFVFPIIGVFFWMTVATLAIMAVPKAAMYEDDFFQLWES
jgi:hypothetical protein